MIQLDSYPILLYTSEVEAYGGHQAQTSEVDEHKTQRQHKTP